MTGSAQLRRELRRFLPDGLRRMMYGVQIGRRRRWTRWPGIECVPARTQAVLTFDDGPDEDDTVGVLDALDAFGAHATFFVLGEQIERHRSLVREICTRGHELALHGYSHLRHDAIPAQESRDDVLRGFDRLSAATTNAPRWFRPPYGRMSDAAAETCIELGMKTVYWSGWGMDWEESTAQEIAAEAGRNLTDGSLLLFHDSARYNQRTSAQATSAAVRLLGESARESGLAMVTLGEALNA